MNNNAKLFVLDDGSGLAKLVAKLAASVDLDVKIFFDPMTAIKMMDTEEPMAVLLDLVMPDMDGVEFIVEMANAGHNQVGLILVSDTGEDVLRACEVVADERSVAVWGTLPRPVNQNSLARLLADIKSGKNALTESTSEVPAKSLVGISEGEIITYYQPQVDFATGKVKGLEALARLKHPVLGLLEPNRFIPRAETNASIELITQAVVADVFDRLGSDGSIAKYPISINVSPACVASDYLPDMLAELSAKYGVSTENITLELTETAALRDILDSVETLTRMRLRGYRLSIDDFGTGIASLEKLHKIPFNELKIDQSFVTKALEDAEAAAIVDTSIVLAHRLGMTAVAEGVETQEQFDMLARLGCDLCQGYFVARPMPMTELQSWQQGWSKRLAELINRPIFNEASVDIEQALSNLHMEPSITD